MKTILLVDDSKLLRILNERALTHAGYRVVTAADGEEALRIAGSTALDAVILDMLLPKLGGPEVLRALKNNPATAEVPVIVLTSLAQKNEAKLLSEGATAYFEKSRLDVQNNSEPLVEIVRHTLANQ